MTNYGQRLTLCTFTGVDETTSFKDLRRLQKDFPFVEIGVLNWPGHADELRYPTIDWIKDFLKETRGGHKALHLCGDSVDAFIAGDKKIRKLAERFDRVQLNFNQAAQSKDIEALNAAVLAYGKPVVTQHNDGNATLWQQITAPNHNVLFDGSSGTGTKPDTWPAPLPFKVCGYAGGLTPKNYATEVAKMFKIAGQRPFWTDMETGVQASGGGFDVAKARKVAQIAAGFRV